MRKFGDGDEQAHKLMIKACLKKEVGNANI